MRTLSAGTATDGAELVATDHEGFITALINATKVRQMGISVMTGLRGNVVIPRQTTTSTASWIASEGGDASLTDPQFETISMTPKTLGAATAYTRQLLLQSTPTVEGIVRNDLARQIGLALDQAAINGSGTSGEPEGIMTDSNVPVVSIGANGGPMTYAKTVEIIETLADGNAIINDSNLGFLTNAKVQAELLQIEKATNTAQFVWEGNANSDGGQILGITARASNQIPSNLNEGIGF